MPPWFSGYNGGFVNRRSRVQLPPGACLFSKHSNSIKTHSLWLGGETMSVSFELYAINTRHTLVNAVDMSAILTVL